MAITNEDLLKFSKSTELVIEFIEDDSSDGTQVKILNLKNAVKAVGSLPGPNGEEMKVESKKVYVAADDIKKFMDQANIVDGTPVYKGDMHLDVSKPVTRSQNGVVTVVRMPKIWLRSVKFSRAGTSLQQQSAASQKDFMSRLFAGNKTLNLESDTASVAKLAEEISAKPETQVAGKKPEPVVTANKT